MAGLLATLENGGRDAGVGGDGGVLWAKGRVALPGGRARLGWDWYWHAAPHSEWDGQPTWPPGWA